MKEGKNLKQNLDKSNEKLHISDVSDSIKKLPERCPCCFKIANYTDIIKKQKNDLHEEFEYESDAWFCNFCGGLVCWK
jgi:hypothetical protein